MSTYQLYFLRNYINHKCVQIYGKKCWLASVGTLNLSDTNWGWKSFKSLLSNAAEGKKNNIQTVFNTFENAIVIRCSFLLLQKLCFDCYFPFYSVVYQIHSIPKSYLIKLHYANQAFDMIITACETYCSFSNEDATVNVFQKISPLFRPSD